MGNKWKIASVAIIMVVSFFVWRTSHEEEPTYQALGEASSKQEIKNVETFTKLFGYIRYFHPSDEVDHLNWQRFSVYGIQEIMTARDRFELKDRLEELFYPIAPTMQIYYRGKEPEVASYNIEKKIGLRKVFWQHNGVEPHGNLNSTIYRSKRIYKSQNSTLINPLFDKMPEREIIDVQIGQGIYARIPMVLYTDTNHTLGSTEESRKQYKALQKDLEDVKLSLYEVQGKEIKWAGVAVTWNVVQHFHPFYNRVHEEWGNMLAPTLQKAKDAPDLEAYVKVLKKMLMPLKDENTTVRAGSEPIFSVPIRVQWVDNKLVVRSADKQSKFQPGDVLLSRNGVSVEDFVNEEISYIPGSSYWKKYEAGNQFIRDKSITTTNFEILRDGEKMTVNAYIDHKAGNKLESLNFDKYNRMKAYKELEDGVWYFNAVHPNVNRSSFRNHINDLKEAESIIIDLRGSIVNSMRDILSHMIKEKKVINLNNQINTIYPDHKDESITYTKQLPYTILPEEPYLDQKIILLTDHSTSFMADGILNIMKQNQRGIVVGQTTKGELFTSSISIQLPNYLNVRMTMSLTELHEPTLDEAFPVIQPDHKVEPSLKAIKQGRDEYIEKALKVIKQDK